MDIDGYISSKDLKQIFGQENPNLVESEKSEILEPHLLMIGDEFQGTIIENKTLLESSFSGQKVAGVKFFGCHFYKVDFTGTLFWMSTFQKCTFEDCFVDRAVFRKCEIHKTEFRNCSTRFYANISESYVYDSNFVQCRFEGLEISGTDTYNIHYEKCFISGGRFQANFTYRDSLKRWPEEQITDEQNEILKSGSAYDDVIYEDCSFDFMEFRMIDFIDTKFINCKIAKNQFTDCQIHDYSFDESNIKDSWGTNSMDLSTMFQSELNPIVLKSLFNVESSTLQKIKNLTKKRILNSVFISYSFKDSFLALLINEELKKHGVTTFLWHDDAPGGQNLKSIMKSNIRSKDKLLFIASEDSLKSQACHFELSQGRSIQDKSWKNILFPIHVDDFLFNVEHDQIRPLAKRDEFWANISELREVNSLDFKSFKNESLLGENREDFLGMISKLIESLAHDT